jgi:hypothetical protein
LSEGGFVDCTRKTSEPLTVSSKDGSNSPSEKATNEELLNWLPKFSAILVAKLSVLLPAKNLTEVFILPN